MKYFLLLALLFIITAHSYAQKEIVLRLKRCFFAISKIRNLSTIGIKK